MKKNINYADINIETARNLIREFRYNDALNMLEMLKTDDLNIDLNFEIARVNFLIKNYSKAIELFEQILKIKFHFHSSLLLAKSYKESGKYKLAVRTLFFAKKKCQYAEQEEIINLIVSVFKECKRADLAVDFIKKSKNTNFSNELESLYPEILNDMTYRNLHGLSLKKYKKNIDETDNIKFKNAVLNEYEIGEKKVVLSSMPRRLNVFLTNACNIQCKMCGVVKYERQELPEDVRKDIISFFPYLEDIIWVGGEVFLYRDFFSLLEYAGKLGIKQSLSTNGMLITDEIARKLCAYNVEISFSIDSICKSTYEYIRYGADFDKLLEKIKLVNSYRNKDNVFTTMHYVLSEYNLNEDLEKTIEFAHKNKFNKILFIIDHFAKHDIKNKIILHFSSVKNKLYGLSKQLNIQLISHIPGGFYESSAAVSKSSDGAISSIPYCFIPWKMLTIDANYSVRPDCFCPEIGNYKSERIIDIWNNAKYIALRKSILNNDKICNPICYNSNRKFY